MHARLGNYQVERKLADGGMGSVYLATSPSGARVVLKVPHAHDRDSQLALADEARAGMRLKHPAIVETLDFFHDKGTSVLVVAYVDGCSLFELRKRAGALSAAAIAEMGVALASALDAIHTAVDEQGRPLLMIHRDVSPNNVLVDGSGQVHLIDLGIVRSRERTQKATLQGMVKGTLRYLAPEILNGQDHSPATDLWALGLTLWEAALGRYAIPGDEMNAVRAIMDNSIYARLRESEIDPSLVDVLGALIAPVDARLRNARAATSVLARLSQRMVGGKTLLARAARLQGSGVAPIPNPIAAPAAVPEPTEIAPRDALQKVARDESSSEGNVEVEPNAATALSPRNELSDVFSSSAPGTKVARGFSSSAPPLADVPTAPSFERPEIATPIVPATTPPLQPPRPVTMSPIPRAAVVDVAPTIQMPAVDPPHRSPPPRSDSVDSAPTIQMGAWTPASGPMSAVTPPSPPPPKPPPPPRIATSPRAQTPPPPPPAAQTQTPPASAAKPTASLFLPIVVVDDDGEEIG